jgi:hypothetical protein
MTGTALDVAATRPCPPDESRRRQALRESARLAAFMA